MNPGAGATALKPSQLAPHAPPHRRQKGAPKLEGLLKQSAAGPCARMSHAALTHKQQEHQSSRAHHCVSREGTCTGPTAAWAAATSMERYRDAGSAGNSSGAVGSPAGRPDFHPPPDRPDDQPRSTLLSCISQGEARTRIDRGPRRSGVRPDQPERSPGSAQVDSANADCVQCKLEDRSAAIRPQTYPICSAIMTVNMTAAK